MLCLSALGSVLMDAGLPIEVGARRGGRASFVSALQRLRARRNRRVSESRRRSVVFVGRGDIAVAGSSCSRQRSGASGGDPPPEVKREVGARASRVQIRRCPRNGRRVVVRAGSTATVLRTGRRRACGMPSLAFRLASP